MADGITHAFVSAKGDGADTTVVQPSDWNAAHVVDIGATTATFVLALGTPATTGANKTNALVMPNAGTIKKAYAVAKTGPTGAALVFDINKNGTTIWTTQGNRLTIAAGETTGTQTSFDVATFVEGDLLTIDIDTVGSAIAGQDITVVLRLQPQ